MGVVPEYLLAPYGWQPNWQNADDRALFESTLADVFQRLGSYRAGPSLEPLLAADGIAIDRVRNVRKQILPVDPPVEILDAGGDLRPVTTIVDELRARLPQPAQPLPSAKDVFTTHSAELSENPLLAREADRLLLDWAAQRIGSKAVDPVSIRRASTIPAAVVRDCLRFFATLRFQAPSVRLTETGIEAKPLLLLLGTALANCRAPRTASEDAPRFPPAPALSDVWELLANGFWSEGPMPRAIDFLEKLTRHSVIRTDDDATRALGSVAFLIPRAAKELQEKDGWRRERWLQLHPVFAHALREEIGIAEPSPGARFFATTNADRAEQRELYEHEVLKPLRARFESPHVKLELGGDFAPEIIAKLLTDGGDVAEIVIPAARVSPFEHAGPRLLRKAAFDRLAAAVTVAEGDPATLFGLEMIAHTPENPTITRTRNRVRLEKLRFDRLPAEEQHRLKARAQIVTAAHAIRRLAVEPNLLELPEELVRFVTGDDDLLASLFGLRAITPVPETAADGSPRPTYEGWETDLRLLARAVGHQTGAELDWLRVRGETRPGTSSLYRPIDKLFLINHTSLDRRSARNEESFYVPNQIRGRFELRRSSYAALRRMVTTGIIPSRPVTHHTLLDVGLITQVSPNEPARSQDLQLFVDSAARWMRALAAHERPYVTLRVSDDSAPAEAEALRAELAALTAENGPQLAFTSRADRSRQLAVATDRVAADPATPALLASLGTDIDRARKGLELMFLGRGAYANRNWSMLFCDLQVDGDTSPEVIIPRREHREEAFARQSLHVWGLRPAQMMPLDFDPLATIETFASDRLTPFSPKHTGAHDRNFRRVAQAAAAAARPTELDADVPIVGLVQLAEEDTATTATTLPPRNGADVWRMNRIIPRDRLVLDPPVPYNEDLKSTIVSRETGAHEEPPPPPNLKLSLFHRRAGSLRAGSVSALAGNVVRAAMFQRAWMIGRPRPGYESRWEPERVARSAIRWVQTEAVDDDARAARAALSPDGSDNPFADETATVAWLVERLDAYRTALALLPVLARSIGAR